MSGAAWAGDGFFYSRYPAPEKGKELSTKNVNHQVFFHRLGTPQSSDELVFSDPGQPGALPHGGDDRGRTVPGAHRLGPRQRQEGQRRLLPRPADEGHDLSSDRRRDWRRHLQRDRQRRRPVPRAHRPQGAQRTGVPVRSEDAGRERLEGRAAGAARAARRRGHRRRQALRQLSQGRDLPGLRLRPHRQAGARNRTARPRRDLGPGRTGRRQGGVLHLHLVQLPADHLQVRRRGQDVVGVPRA